MTSQTSRMPFPFVPRNTPDSLELVGPWYGNMSTLFLTIQHIFMDHSYGDELEEMLGASSILTWDCRGPIGWLFGEPGFLLILFFIPLFPPVPSLGHARQRNLV